jgi:hypothetical protein
MFDSSQTFTREETAGTAPEPALAELELELARQNVELTEALDWLREQGDAALMFDGELLDQLDQLDELAAELMGGRAVEIPTHLARC